MKTITKDQLNDWGTNELHTNPETGETKPDSKKITVLYLRDFEPNFIEDVPSILDEYGMKKLRQKMDQAHNSIIEQKFNLALFKEELELRNLDKPEHKPGTVNPFTEAMDKSTKPQPRAASPEEIQKAIDIESFYDPEYREISKEFIKEVYPVLEAESIALQEEVNAAYAEMAEIVRECKEKVRAAKKKRDDFNAQVWAEICKFSKANNGGGAPVFKKGDDAAEGHRWSHSLLSKYKPGLFHFAKPQKFERYKGLSILQHTIEDIEAKIDKPDNDDRRILSQISEQYRPGRYAPDATAEGTGGGFKEVMKNFFK